MTAKLKIVKSLPHFSVDAKDLREALELGVPEKKTTVPILVNVLFQLEKDILRITTTDLDQSVVTEIDALPSRHKTHEPFTIPWRKTLDLLHGESGLVIFTPLENNWVKMTVGGVEYKLIGMAKKNYPNTPEPVAPLYNISGETLTEVLTHTIFAISNEESRYTLSGALFQFNNGRLRVAATDGHRLAIETREMDITVKDGNTHDVLVRRNALSWLLSKSKRIGKEFVGISTDEHTIFFSLPHIRTIFSTRKLTGKFPNIDAVTPNDNDRVIAKFDSAEAFSKILLRVARFSDERSGCVRFNFNGKVTLSAESTETGEATADVPAVITGAEEFAIKIGLNSGYVLDGLKVIGKKRTTVHLKDTQSAVLLTSPDLDGFKYILMPMRI